MADKALLERRRQEILTAAEQVFNAKGYAATTMDEVAMRAGISKGSIYNYFKNKQELFSSVFLCIVPEQQAAERKIGDPSLSAMQKLVWLLDEWFGRLEMCKRVGKLVLECWATAAREERQGTVGAIFSSHYNGWRGDIIAVLKEGLQSGEFRLNYPVEIGASLILAIIDGLTLQTIMDLREMIDSDFLAAMKKAIITALTSDGGMDDLPALGQVKPASVVSSQAQA